MRGRYPQRIARKLEGLRARRVRGRPRIDREVEGLIIRMAEENRSWGMIGSSGRSPIWDMRSLIRRSATAASSRYTAGAGAQTQDHLGRIHSDPPRVARRDGHFRARGPYARIRAIFYIFGEL